MKYTIKTFGTPCHYQFSNIEDVKVNDIENGEIDYHELEETFLSDNCSLENEKISVDDEIQFEIHNSNGKILDFTSRDIEQSDNGGDCFTAEPEYNDEYKNCLGSVQYFKGGGPVFELETDDEIKIENFTYSCMTLELDDGEITLMNYLYYNNKKLENTDFGTSWGSHRFVKIWKQNGDVVEINV
tara:strand:- start:948 stop:1502 length:555 start_codon:yes stop_codon:yes gene_type:complete